MFFKKKKKNTVPVTGQEAEEKETTDRYVQNQGEGGKQ